MADLEKVLNGLESCLHNHDCKNCRYKDEYDHSLDCIDRNRTDAIELLKSQQAEIERLKEKDRLHCEDCAYNGICETPHTDKSPLCAEYSIVR